MPSDERQVADTERSGHAIRASVLALVLPETRGCRCYELDGNTACDHCTHMASGILVDLKGMGWTLTRIDGQADG